MCACEHSRVHVHMCVGMCKIMIWLRLCVMNDVVCSYMRSAVLRFGMHSNYVCEHEKLNVAKLELTTCTCLR